MPLSLLCLFFAVIFSGCQALQSRIPTEISESWNPSLWVLQILTAEVRNQEGQWPAAEADYLRIFGDSVSTLFQEKELIFRTRHDTLTISYTLLNRNVHKESYFEFTGEVSNGQFTTDSASYHITSLIQHANNTKRFQANQGSITFYQHPDKSISVKHTYAHGYAETTIKVSP